MHSKVWQLMISGEQKGLDIWLISLISGFWLRSKRDCFQRFLECFTLWPLSTDIWLILRCVQQILLILLKSVRFNQEQPKVLGVKFCLREIERIFFPNKVRNFQLWKMPKLLNFRFLEGRYFLNCDNIELRRSSKIFFFCFRMASLGGGALIEIWSIFSWYSFIIALISG